MWNHVQSTLHMKNTRLLQFCASLIVLFCLSHNTAQAEPGARPAIDGDWISLDADGKDTEAVIKIEQDGKHLSGLFTDYKDGKVIVEAPLIGYIDKHGGVIFDLQFGRIKSTNRLQLSEDQNRLEGTFINTMGNEGEVHLRRK